jgi:hypothetical protein
MQGGYGGPPGYGGRQEQQYAQGQGNGMAYGYPGGMGGPNAVPFQPQGMQPMMHPGMMQQGPGPYGGGAQGYQPPPQGYGSGQGMQGGAAYGHGGMQGYGAPPQQGMYGGQGRPYGGQAGAPPPPVGTSAPPRVHTPPSTFALQFLSFADLFTPVSRSLLSRILLHPPLFSFGSLICAD